VLGQKWPQVSLSGRGLEPEQNDTRRSAGSGKVGVAGQLAGDTRERSFAASVELKEEVNAPLVVRPCSVAVGTDKLPEVLSAALFRPPMGERGIGMASGVRSKSREEPVYAEQVSQPRIGGEASEAAA
jgi:hypothetical protein